MGPSKSSYISNTAVFHFHDSGGKSNIKGLEAIKIHLGHFTTMLKTSGKIAPFKHGHLGRGYPFVQFQGGRRKTCSNDPEKLWKRAQGWPNHRKLHPSDQIKASPKTQARDSKTFRVSVSVKENLFNEQCQIVFYISDKILPQLF